MLWYEKFLIAVWFGGVLSIIYAALTALLLWIVLLIILKKINKYNIRNVWFWILSILQFPISIIALFLLFSIDQIKTKVVSPAKDYAESLVSTINSTPHNVVNAASSLAKGRIHEIDYQPESTIGLYAADYAVEVVDDAIDNTADKVDNLIPDEIIASIIKKFPSLEYFLTNHKIKCDTDLGIVDSIFLVVNTGILKIQKTIAMILILLIIVFILLCVLAGFIKLSRKKRKESRRIRGN